VTLRFISLGQYCLDFYKGTYLMRIFKAQRRLTIILLLLSLLPAWAAAKKAPYDGIVVIGDSLSDPGNKHAITGLANTPPYDLLNEFLIPDGPYTKGGLHHSNGATWVEQYARPLGLGGDVRPAYQGNGKATNYAYGGARAREPSEDPPEILDCVPPTNNKNLSDQITDFLADVNLSPSSGALYAVFIGGNDVADAVRALQCDGTGASSVGIVVRALEGVAGAVGELYSMPGAIGARKFLVVNSPDLGFVPSFDPPSPASFFGTCFSRLYNFGTANPANWPSTLPSPDQCLFPSGIPGLVDVLNGLAANPSLDGIEIVTYDIYSKIVQLVTAPMDGEPQNGRDACVMPNIPPYSCKDPGDHVFWDGIHPTKAVHSILADEIGAVLAQ
jgi:phospholipase/lecithinase/hemolysin